MELDGRMLEPGEKPPEAQPLDPMIVQALTADLMVTCPQVCCDHECTTGNPPRGRFERPSAYEIHYFQAQRLLRQGWVNRA